MDIRRWAGAFSFVALAACASPRQTEETSPKFAPAGLKVQSYEDIEKLSGQRVTVEGMFKHLQGIHGIIELDGGLWIYLPHFDLFRRGDDWLKYVGQRCSATGILHTYTKDIPGYHGPSLLIDGFSGPGS